MGMLIGSVTWGFLSDRFGRKKVPHVTFPMRIGFVGFVANPPLVLL